MGYNEKVEQVNIQGQIKTWTRAKLISCENFYQKTPTMIFMEEDITIGVDGKPSTTPHATLRVEYDPKAVIPFINPETELAFTDEQKTQICEMIKSGNINHSLCSALIYSIYIYSAKERDIKVNKTSPSI